MATFLGERIVRSAINDDCVIGLYSSAEQVAVDGGGAPIRRPLMYKDVLPVGPEIRINVISAYIASRALEQTCLITQHVIR